MKTLSDLPENLVEKIFSKVPLTSLRSVRSTCTKWDDLSQTQILGEANADSKKKLLGFMLINEKICSMRFDLQGIRNDGDDFTEFSIKQVTEFDDFNISQIFHCDGLLLCVVSNNRIQSSLMVDNMYLGQRRWIRHSGVRSRFQDFGLYALGYDNNNRNHKILSDNYFCDGYQIYDFNSNSWRGLNVADKEKEDITFYKRGLSLNGNAYFFAQERYIETYEIDEEKEEAGVLNQVILLCFDFTSETFGPILPLPFDSEGIEVGDTVALSCVRDEQLAVLCQHYNMIGIWVSTKIDPYNASWKRFLVFNEFPANFTVRSFFIDEEKHVAVVFDCYHTAYIIGEGGYSKTVNIGDDPAKYHLPVVCTSYAPSLVQLDID